jgi:sugar lactone lactonase YvrE
MLPIFAKKASMKKTVCLVIQFCCFLFVSSAQPHQLVKKWETDTLFKVPESVLWDDANKVFYVTNIDGTDSWGRDGKGSVGKMSRDGKILEVEWVKGMDAPKGMGLYKDKLYIADFENIVVVDVPAGKIEKKIKIDGAIGLNDLAIDPGGVIYVSDSKAKKIFRVEDGISSLYLDSLKGPNGVMIHKGVLYAVSGDGLYKVGKDKTLTPVATGLTNGSTDGLTAIGNDFLVSIWQGSIWYVYADGRKELLVDSRDQKRNTADIWFDAETGLLYVPGFWTNTITAYEVK